MKILKTLLKALLLLVPLLFFLLVVAYLFIDSYFTPAQQAKIILLPGKGYINGSATKPKGLIPFVLPGIKGVEIKLTPGGRTTFSDKKGNYLIKGLDPGVYSVSFKAEGYELTTKKGIMVTAGSDSQVQAALFPDPDGAPQAALELSSPVPGRKLPEAFTYKKNLQISTAKSKNVSFSGFRWQIKNEKGEILFDPYSEAKKPLQLEPSPAFGVSPYIFLFNPPYPGKFSIKLNLSNKLFPDITSTAEIQVKAVNVKPEAVPSVIAGPVPLRKVPVSDLRSSSGLKIVPVSSVVYLKGFAVDENIASPELYNPGGVSPDIYGKNHDHFQRKFGWHWKIQYTKDYGNFENASASDVSELLRDNAENSGQQIQYPHFTPSKPGTYIVTLVVNDNDPFGSPLISNPASITVKAVDDQPSDINKCAECHAEIVKNYSLIAHGRQEIECESCHGPAVLHLQAAEQNKKKTISRSMESGICGQCHDQYNEWEKSRHSDGESFGYAEIAKPLLVNCYKCHYAESFSESIEKILSDGISFHDLQYKKRFMSIGPLMPDFSKLPAKDESRITCQACHDSHPDPTRLPYGVRISGEEHICSTCHYEKWQNAVLEGIGGKIKNGYEYPFNNYDFVNSHNTRKKCVLCHMDKEISNEDMHKVRAVGGHTLRMRDAGKDNILGGFGPRNENPDIEKDSGTTDDILNIAPCRKCHSGLTAFNRNNFQKKVYEKWTELGELLKSLNNGKLPDYKPGNKCAVCHRGGTLPFDVDPRLILENAYTNYKLVKNDRSWGIHNPKYIMKLLDDSITSAKQNYEISSR